MRDRLSRILAALALLSLLVPAGATQLPPAEGARATALATNCLTCHALGAGRNPIIPSLAGRSADFIADALQQFRDGRRGATVMDRIARGYSPAESALIGAWFEGQRSGARP